VVREWCGPRIGDDLPPLVSVGMPVEVFDQLASIGVPELLCDYGRREPHDDVMPPRAVVPKLNECRLSQARRSAYGSPPVTVIRLVSGLPLGETNSCSLPVKVARKASQAARLPALQSRGAIDAFRPKQKPFGHMAERRFGPSS
jgi:hypothetical protein